MNSRETNIPLPSIRSTETLRARILRRHRADRRFRFYGFSAMVITLAVLVLVFITVLERGISL